eukprot:TRINITY_DN6685_c1_g1_i1.p1 TRINITY_DN6685_c1_g1~~TRINITY_DN6685_c1_g1_i1.p1  ORF type:complete len:575 (-),score=153.56 TRINITY_DN6685_c1_g1_i1:151-1875(-)
MVLIPVPREFFIPIPLHVLLEALQKQVARVRGREEGARFGEFCEILEAIYHHRSHKLRNSLKRDFFQTGGSRRMKGKAVAEADARLNDERFVVTFNEIMEKANYSVLSQEEWDDALRESFSFTVDVDIHWSRLDPSVLKGFLAARPELQNGCYEHANRVLVFHRGVGEEKLCRRFIGEKIDLLIGYVVSFLRWLLTCCGLCRCCRRQRSKGERSNTRCESNGSSCKEENGVCNGNGATNGHGHREPGAHSNGATASTANGGGSRAAAASAQPYVRRETLRSVMPNALAVLLHFFREVTIYEPTFRDLVLLYYDYPEKPKKTNKELSSRTKIEADASPNGGEETADQVPVRSQLNVKSFHSIPMADLEVVFPHKRVAVQPKVKLSLSIHVVMTLMAVARVWKASEGRGMVKAIWGGVSLMAMKTMSMYHSMQRSKQNAQSRMTQTLYSSSLDSGLGVVHDLVDSMEEQEVKEAMMGYWALLQPSNSNRHEFRSEKDIDDECENFLLDTFGAVVDFEVEDALGKLLRDGLARRRGDQYEALPLEEATRHLVSIWASLHSEHWSMIPVPDDDDDDLL